MLYSMYGQIIRHLLNRIREHRRLATPMGAHFRACNVQLTMSDVTIIASSLKAVSHLMTLEAFCINEMPEVNLLIQISVDCSRVVPCCGILNEEVHLSCE